MEDEAGKAMPNDIHRTSPAPASSSHPPTPHPPKSRGSAFWVALGIFLSRISGLVRESIFAHYLGNSAAADAFRAAQRIPNILQNLLGEGALSASFIPAYSRLLAEGRREEAGRLAGAVAGLLAVAVSLGSLAGVLAAPWLTRAIAFGFTGAKYDLTVTLVRIFFPGIGVLVLSAWCLGILNSHRRFFLPYAVPVLLNAVVVVALIAYGGNQGQEKLAVTVTIANTLGSAVIFLVQLPAVLRLETGLRLSLDTAFGPVREVIRNFTPAVMARGVVQISSYTDSLLASLLPTGGVAALTYAQIIYLLPVSLFGISISAAELPELSSALGTEAEVAAKLRARLDAALRRVAFFVVPTVVAFLMLGNVAVAAVYQAGKFAGSDTLLVWRALAGATVGLLAATQARLYSSTFYALKDTRTPFKFAAIRVTLGIAMGIVGCLVAPRVLGLDPLWGVAGLTMASGMAGWIEFFLLRRGITKRIGKTGLGAGMLLRLWGAALTAAVPAYCLGRFVPWPHRWIAAIGVFGVYGTVYLAVTGVFRVPEAESLVRRVLRRRGSDKKAIG